MRKARSITSILGPGFGGLKIRLSRKLASLAALAALLTLALNPVSSATQTSDTANLNVERLGHTATRLADDRILIIGGESYNGPVGDSEIFDPGSNEG